MPSSGNACSHLDSLDAESSREWSMVAPAQTELQNIIGKRLCCVFQGDVAKVASAVGVPRQLILNDLQSELRQFSSTNPESPNTKRGSQRSKALPSWYKKLTEPRQRPFYFPCHHDGPCTEENCTCVQNAFFCTKHCIWGATSRNFSTGCKCAAKCTSQSCPCMASNRECDPDYCKSCGCCTDPAHRPPVDQRCRNDNIGQRRHNHLLVAKSRVPQGGWGLFNMSSLKKGDYIHEVSCCCT
jgi:CXC domain